MAKEKNLTAITTVAAADFVRAVTSAGASVKATFANVAKYVIETYNGSTVAGSAQSVKSALDSLNSNMQVYTAFSSSSPIVVSCANNGAFILFGYIQGLTTAGLLEISIVSGSITITNIGTNASQSIVSASLNNGQLTITTSNAAPSRVVLVGLTK